MAVSRRGLGIVMAIGILGIASGCSDEEKYEVINDPAPASDDGGSEDAWGSQKGNEDEDTSFGALNLETAEATAKYYGADEFRLDGQGAGDTPNCILTKKDGGATISVSGSCKLGKVEGREIYIIEGLEKNSLSKKK